MSEITLMAIFKKLFGGDEKPKQKYDGTVIITKKEEE